MSGPPPGASQKALPKPKSSPSSSATPSIANMNPPPPTWLLELHNQVADELLQYGRDMDDHENQVRAAMESAVRTQGRHSSHRRDLRHDRHGVCGDDEPGRSLRVAGRLNQEELESNYKGHKKFILGRIKKAIHAAQTEQKTYEALATKHRATHSKIDIMEIFAGSGTVSKTAVRYGLTATTPIDYNTGYDLSQPDSQVACDRMLQTLRPLFLLASIHRTPRLVMQENMNYNTRPELLEQLREEERPIVEKTMDWCKRQHSEGRFYLIENPNNSRLWEEPSVVAMLQETNGMVTTCHSGAYGATNSKGQKIKKTFKFASNNKDILYYLSEKLNAEELAQCIPLQGKEVTLSQHYPDGLVASILKGIKYVARQMNPARFLPKKVLANYSLPQGNQQQWNTLMQNAFTLMEQTATKNYVLGPDLQAGPAVDSMASDKGAGCQTAIGSSTSFICSSHSSRVCFAICRKRGCRSPNRGPQRCSFSKEPFSKTC